MLLSKALRLCRSGASFSERLRSFTSVVILSYACMELGNLLYWECTIFGCVHPEATLSTAQVLTKHCLQDAGQIVELWNREFTRSQDVNRMLALIYLANDILQNSRKKGPQFVNEFFTRLPPAVEKLVKAGGTEVCLCWPLRGDNAISAGYWDHIWIDTYSQRKYSILWWLCCTSNNVHAVCILRYAYAIQSVQISKAAIAFVDHYLEITELGTFIGPGEAA